MVTVPTATIPSKTMKATPGHQILLLSVSTDGMKKCVLSDDLGIGDCVQFRGSYIALHRLPEEEGDLATFIWRATVMTRSHPWLLHDTWQNSWDFGILEVAGDLNSNWVATVARVTNQRGPDMDDDNKKYGVFRSGTVLIKPELWDQINAVHWYYEC
jgi:hypothetical protein